MSKETNQLKSGVLLSYINLAIGSAIPFIYTPIMLRLLGQAEYGLYALSHSITGYLSLLSFGLGGTIIRYITKYKVEKNKEKEQEMFGLFLSMYFILSVLVIIVGFFLVLGAESFFAKGLSSEEISKLKVLISIMTINTAVVFPSGVFTSVVLAHERYVFERSVSIILTVGTPIMNLIILLLGFGSIGMAAAGLALQIITTPVFIIYSIRRLKLKPVFKKPQSGLLKEIIGFSFFVFLGAIVDMLFWATDKVILGALASTAAVAIYNIGGTFNTIVTQLSTTISGVLTPRIMGMVVLEKTKEELTAILIKIGRLQFIIIGLVVSGFVVFGAPFIKLWAGEDYSDSYYVALLTLLPLVIPLIQNVALTVVVAQNKHRFRAVVYLIIAVLNVVSTWFVVPYYGLVGAAVCSAISYILGQGIIMNYYYYKVIKLDIFLFWRNILKLMIIPIIMIIFGLISCKFIDYNNTCYFFIGVGVYTVLYCVLMFFFTMNKYEKELLLSPFRKIFRRRN